MGDRKRINVSVDERTYAVLKQIKDMYGFSSICEMVVALVNIMMDRMDSERSPKYDIPTEDGEYIDQMFEELGVHDRKIPDGTIPRRRNNYGKG